MFAPLRFDGSLWALSRSPFDIDEVWQGWLGLRTEHFLRSNLFLIATGPSKSPGLLDAENVVLERSVRFLFLALIIEGLYLERAGLILQGNRLADPIGFQVRAVHDTTRAFRLEGSATSLELSMKPLVRAAQVSSNMQLLLDMKPVPRLWRGVMSLISAFEARAGLERLHRFVRALEAITKSPRGEGERKFVHRGSIFAGRSESNRSLLRELYRLRSASEHLNDFQSVLEGYPWYEQEQIALHRAEQAEVLARHVFIQILSSERLTRLFSEDAWLDQFWALPDDQTSAFWGDPLDLSSIPLPPFRFD